jgi:hypothetical protein
MRSGGRRRRGLREERVRVVDRENPAANDFLPVARISVAGQLHTCRLDLARIVNGLPWVVIEPCAMPVNASSRHAWRPAMTPWIMVTGTNSASGAMTTGFAASKDFMAFPYGRRVQHGGAIWQCRDGSGPGAGEVGRIETSGRPRAAERLVAGNKPDAALARRRWRCHQLPDRVEDYLELAVVLGLERIDSTRELLIVAG